jgi:16S rRNA (cytosine967-C5)-methyltransferase
VNARAAAAKALAAVLEQGKSLDAALPAALETVSVPSDRALVQEICYGVLRWLPRLEAIAAELLRKPFKRKDRDVYGLVLLGLYQLIYMRVPAYAAVAETVDAARATGKTWASGLVNAVLRGYLREAERLLAKVDRHDEARLAHPGWLLDRFRQDWPNDWRMVAEANNARAPMTLRVNLQRQDREAYCERLRQANIAFHQPPFVSTAVVLEAPSDVAQLPGFLQGAVSVQDAAAQLAAELLDARPGMRILDACAAPGGKTAHILERVPDLAQLVALDIDRQRLKRVQDNLERLRLNAQLCSGDAADPSAWWDGQPFERILLDAPCSATGVIRRHPDIKVLRKAGDVEALAEHQAEILRALWPLLAPGGILLYATCSILDRENAQQIGSFLQLHRDAREYVIEADWGRSCQHGRQILPGEYEMDGFYYACITRLHDWT